MGKIIKLVSLIVVVSFSAISNGMSGEYYDQLNDTERLIVEKMPESWQVLDVKRGVIPYGHYDGVDYKGPQGLLLTVEGSRTVYLHWKDNEGLWHREPLAKESLELWIMPPEYHRSWRRFFSMKGPIPAEKIYSGSAVKIYAKPGHYISDSEALDELISSQEAVSTSWPESPSHTGEISWPNWKNDIKQAIDASN